jgi:kynurenine formamidase
MTSTSEIDHELPTYQALLTRTDAPPGSAWGLWGDDDEAGTVNLLTPERVVAAVALVEHGEIYPLQLPLHLPVRTEGNARKNPRHTLLRVGHERAEELLVEDVPDAGTTRDDILDGLYLQGSSHWDALAHIRHPLHGNYNGVPDTDIRAGSHGRLGIDVWSQRGIAGRGVLLDVVSFFESRGRTLDPFSSYGITVSDLKATAEWQKTTIQTGDILLVRTGFAEAAGEAPGDLSMGAPGSYSSTGLEVSDEMLEHLWDLHVAALASDSLGVEVSAPANGAKAWELHETMIALWGMPLGEMWFLKDLAKACATHGRYEFFLTSCPLNLAGGVGSPPQAMAFM